MTPALIALLAAAALWAPSEGDLPRWPIEARWGLLVLGAAAWAAWSLLRGQGIARSKPGCAAFALAACCALRAALAGAGEEASFRVAEWFALAAILAWASRASPRPILRTLAVLGAFTAVLLIVQRAGGGDGSATFGHKGLAACFLSLALPCATLLALEGRIASGLCAGTIAAGLAWCDTRAAWLGGAAGLGVLFLLLRPSMGAGILLRMGVLIAGVLLVSGLALSQVAPRGGPDLAENLPERLGGALSPGDRNLQLRAGFWGACVRAWARSPWTGQGPGSFVEASLKECSGLPADAWDGMSRYAHNDLLQAGVETGWIGAGLLLALAGTLAISASRLPKGGEARLAGAAAAGGLAAGAMNAGFSFPLEEAGCAAAMAALAGILAGVGVPPPPDSKTRPLLAWALVLAALLSLRAPLALALARSGHPEAAAALAPSMGSVRDAQAEAFVARGDTDEALRACGQALRRWPGDPWALGERGRVRLLTGDPSGALQDLEAAVRQGPWNAGARVHLAVARFRLGDREAAYAGLEACLRELPDFGPLIHGAWGRLLAIEGRDPLGALDHLELSLAQSPADERLDLEYWIARCRAALGGR